MNAISGTRRAMKEMADGTIRVQIDIDPACRASFLQMFPTIDLPVAIAPLVNDFESRQEPVREEAKGGALAKLAGMWCNESAFQKWIREEFNEKVTSSFEAADFIRAHCHIKSRAELDSSPAAAKRFNDDIREPYRDYLESL